MKKREEIIKFAHDKLIIANGVIGDFQKISIVLSGGRESTWFEQIYDRIIPVEDVLSLARQENIGFWKVWDTAMDKRTNIEDISNRILRVYKPKPKSPRVFFSVDGSMEHHSLPFIEYAGLDVYALDLFFFVTLDC